VFTPGLGHIPGDSGWLPVGILDAEWVGCPDRELGVVGPSTSRHEPAVLSIWLKTDGNLPESILSLHHWLRGRGYFAFEIDFISFNNL